MSLTASYTGFYLVGLAMSIPLAKIGVEVWNVIATTTDTIPSLPNGADTVTAATLAGVIAWLLGKTIPDLTKTNREGMHEVANEVKGMRDDFTTASERQLNQQQQQLTLLGEIVRGQK